MPKRIHLQPYLTEPQLHERYRHAHDSVERSRWQFLWLLARDFIATAIARVNCVMLALASIILWLEG
jgi:hypothetical protein